MAMQVGSVTVTNAGVETKSGMAEAIYDALKVQITAQIAPDPFPSGPEGAKALQGLASTATGIAAAALYIQNNAQLALTPSDGGLQRTPNPNSADTPTVGPSVTALFGAIA